MTYRQKKLSSIAAKTGIVIGITAAIASLALPTINRASAVGDNANNLPYGGQIGYIGDSLTRGQTYGSGSVSYNMPSHSAIAALGGESAGWSSLTFGADGTSSASWCNPTYLNQPRDLARSIDNFKQNNVKVLSIMLGTNDANQKVTPEKYLDNMSKIIDIYKEKAGIEKVIINQIPYAVKHDDNLTTAYNAGIYSLADGQSVFIGDTSIYDYTKANKDTIFSDSAGVHLTKDGYDKLGQFWAEAYKRVIVEPDSTNRNVVIDNKANAVTYTVNKDKSWFAPATGKYSNLLVDGQILDASDYTVTGDGSSTTINLAANYVAKLVDGEHDITIRYNDGVNFTDKFTVKHKVSDTNEKNDVNNNSSNNNVDTDEKANQHVVPTAPNTGA